MVLNTRKKSYRGGLGNIYSSLVTGLSPLLSEVKPISGSSIKRIPKGKRKKIISGKKKKRKFSLFNFIRKKHKKKSGKKIKVRVKKRKTSKSRKRKKPSSSNFGKKKKRKIVTKDLFSEK